jgi:hypothetical protein
MHNLAPEVAAKVAVPYAWPIQEEEWDLDYWTTRGFDIFVPEADEIALGKSYKFNMLVGQVAGIPPPRWFVRFHQQIEERCELVAVLPPARDLFGEVGLKIYRLRDHRSRAQRPGFVGLGPRVVRPAGDPQLSN